MKKSLFLLACVLIPLIGSAQNWIRVNQLGYLPEDIKVAVMISSIKGSATEFLLRDKVSGKIVFTGIPQESSATKWGMERAYRLDFSAWQQEGAYVLECEGAVSPSFRIGAEVYEGSSDFLLTYMRQQRCGDNPFLNDSCHTKDGYIVLHPTRSGEHIDVTGGWHDATDYLQYLPTSANAVYQMLFAWYKAPDKSVFRDLYDATGRPGSNGIADILDECRWGLEWLLKMNPAPGEMYNQIADDRDHCGFRLPVGDPADYGWGPNNGRPVYYISGERQGLGPYLNRTTGVASSAGKFASAFALGAAVFADIDKDFATKMSEKAIPALDFAEAFPGNTQTCCTISPYFYEEDNYVDDVELAAATFLELGFGKEWATKADYWGQLEPVTPWMETGRARHYQWYPFLNLGHYFMAKPQSGDFSAKYLGFMRQGLLDIQNRASNCVFYNGVPHVWCHNNLVAAAITQAALYRELSGDTQFAAMEAALRDWLLGCNPWGTSMIVDFPQGAEYPNAPHSSYLSVIGKSTPGGLIDGPIDKDVHASQHHFPDKEEDLLAVFNKGTAVYHDGIWDYASNEPTMDGTASLSYYFSLKAGEGRKQAAALNQTGSPVVVRNQKNCILGMDPSKKEVYFVFTADEMFNGGESVRKTLADHNAKASFFLTGNCLRMKEWKPLIKKIIADDHYVGPHGDRHLLYAPWGEDVEFSLVSADSLVADIRANISELNRFGVQSEKIGWFLASYEHYNNMVQKVSAREGLRLINLTPGIRTNADYITPSMKGYKSSQELIDQLFEFESKNGLNGALILIHPGIVEERTDRLYSRLDEILERLEDLGYTFCRLP